MLATSPRKRVTAQRFIEILETQSPVFTGSDLFVFSSWGLRPGLYANACLAGYRVAVLTAFNCASRPLAAEVPSSNRPTKFFTNISRLNICARLRAAVDICSRK